MLGKGLKTKHPDGPLLETSPEIPTRNLAPGPDDTSRRSRPAAQDRFLWLLGAGAGFVVAGGKLGSLLIGEQCRI